MEEYNSCETPIFIIGLPRSGTKLFREILNNHDNIFIPVAESLFIPYFIKKYGINPVFTSKKSRESFLQDLSQSIYCFNMSISITDLNGSVFSDILQTNSWQCIFKYIFNDLVNSTKKNVRFGDKTPSYINYLPLLHLLYPKASFLHIIRDPRDQGVSARKAFNKSIYLSASTWVRSITSVKEYVKENEINYLELKYEELVDNPELSMSKVFSFLNLKFITSMLYFNESVENLGEAKGLKVIKKNNFNKYLNNLTTNEIRKIEAITYPLMNLLNYKFESDVSKQKKLNFIEEFIFKIHDFLTSYIFHIKDKGLRNGLLYLRRLKKSKI